MVEKVGTIIQARMGSQRLPGKTLMDIGGKPVLWYVYDRASKASKVDKTVIATTLEKTDDSIEKWCLENKTPFFRGSEKDVLKRYYDCAKKYAFNYIVRLTADNPFCDPEIIDFLVNEIKKRNLDYASNRISKRTWPYGLDVEVFTFTALEKAFYEADLERQREHVTPYIMENPDYFKMMEFPLEEDLSSIRLSIDTIEDFDFCKKIIEESNFTPPNWKEIVLLINKQL